MLSELSLYSYYKINIDFYEGIIGLLSSIWSGNQRSLILNLEKKLDR